MLEHILVPLDGSQLAQAALEYATRIVSPTGKITLLTVVNLPEFPIYDFYPTPLVVTQNYEAATADALPRAKDYLNRVAEDMRQTSGVRVEIEVMPGDAAAAIIETAIRLKANAIVMSTHGRSGLGLWLFGSVTNKVLAAAPCPVLVVPNRQKHNPKVAELEKTHAQ